jgi:hypothetical protein
MALNNMKHKPLTSMEGRNISNKIIEIREILNGKSFLLLFLVKNK